MEQYNNNSPVPTIGALYSDASGFIYVYLNDGLHLIPTTELLNELGFNAYTATSVDATWISSVGLSTPLANDYPHAHAQVIQGMGINLANVGGSLANSAIMPATSSGQTAQIAARAGGIGASLSADLSGITGALKAHEMALLLAGGAFLAAKAGLFGHGMRRIL